MKVEPFRSAIKKFNRFFIGRRLDISMQIRIPCKTKLAQSGKSYFSKFSLLLENNILHAAIALLDQDVVNHMDANQRSCSNPDEEQETRNHLLSGNGREREVVTASCRVMSKTISTSALNIDRMGKALAELKKVFIKTYGCQMNVYDSERMADALATAGYEESGNIGKADMVLLNTCHIREKATEKLYSELGRLKPLKAKNPEMKIAVAGCVAQAEGNEIVRRQPLVDIVVGPQAYHRLPSMVGRSGVKNKVVDTTFPLEDKFDRLPKSRTTRQSYSAFLTIQEGCDKFCTFCVVPYTRGAEASRPPVRIVQEAEMLIGRGVREITLLGQNVNAYCAEGPGGSTWKLSDLIWRLAEIDGLDRIRFTTSHPKDMSDDLIAAHGDCPKLMPYLHLPAQSGSDKVLKAMNRKHTAAEYLATIARIRDARPDILLSGDFIVGFPGETEEDFQDTMELVHKVNYGQSYSFKYSARPGTPAAERPQIDPGLASDRLQRLQKLLKSQQVSAQDNMVGKRVSVLFERTGRREGQFAGKSEYLHSVHVDSDASIMGQIADVEIMRSEPNSLSGRIIA